MTWWSTAIDRKQDLRRLRRANYGHVNAFQYVMRTAYGRRGPLKWELAQAGNLLIPISSPR